MILSLTWAMATLCTLGPAFHPSDPIVIHNVNVVDIESGSIHEAKTLSIHDGLIRTISDADSSTPEGAIDATGMYLIPGLWDMHVHLSHVGRHALPLFLAHGITSVRDLGGNLEEIAGLAKAIEEGQTLGPRVRYSGPVLEAPTFLHAIAQLQGRLGAAAKQVAADLVKDRRALSTDEDVDEVIAETIRAGATVVKIRSVGSKEIFVKLGEACQEAGLQLVGHEPLVLPILEASKAGFKCVEHILLSAPNVIAPPASETEEMFKEIVGNGTAFVPTLITSRRSQTPSFRDLQMEVKAIEDMSDDRFFYIGKTLIHFWRFQMELKKLEPPMNWNFIIDGSIDLWKRVVQAGGVLMAGTDAGSLMTFPGLSLHEELVLLVKELEMTPLDALRAATLSPARFSGLDDDLGTIEAGKIADLVLLSKNPLEDIENSQCIEAVIAKGQLFNRTTLDGWIQDAKDAVKDGGR